MLLVKQTKAKCGEKKDKRWDVNVMSSLPAAVPVLYIRQTLFDICGESARIHTLCRVDSWIETEVCDKLSGCNYTHFLGHTATQIIPVQQWSKNTEGERDSGGRKKKTLRTHSLNGVLLANSNFQQFHFLSLHSQSLSGTHTHAHVCQKTLWMFHSSRSGTKENKDTEEVYDYPVQSSRSRFFSCQMVKDQP